MNNVIDLIVLMLPMFAGFCAGNIHGSGVTNDRELFEAHNREFRLQKEAIILGYGCVLKNGEFVWKKAEVGR